jgi:truncated hemoglobin YjbI
MTDAEFIHRLVDAFYARARNDVLIGYHFRNITDFDAHIPRIAAFWDLQLLGKTARDVSEPFDVLKVHVPLGIKRGELGRWLLLFRKTLGEETAAHPDKRPLADEWERKLAVFETSFLRFFGF